jgi:hypothetical protein
MNPDRGNDLGEIAADGEPSVLNAPSLYTREYPLDSRDTLSVMRRFNRSTMWVATGLLGTAFFAALLLVVQERHPSAANSPEEALQTRRNVLLSTNGSTLAENVMLTAESSTDKRSSGQTPSVDNGLTPEINHGDLQANVSSWSPTQRHDSASLLRPKLLHARQRSSTWLRFVDVKRRLLALWHQSLAPAAKSRSWTLFANPNKERRKKVSYIAETTH